LGFSSLVIVTWFDLLMALSIRWKYHWHWYKKVQGNATRSGIQECSNLSSRLLSLMQACRPGWGHWTGFQSKLRRFFGLYSGIALNKSSHDNIEEEQIAFPLKYRAEFKHAVERW
jgi:hypothetical protein